MCRNNDDKFNIDFGSLLFGMYGRLLVDANAASILVGLLALCGCVLQLVVFETCAIPRSMLLD